MYWGGNRAVCALLACAVLCSPGPVPALNISQPAVQQTVRAAPQVQAVPPPEILARLVWTSLLALDNANRTDNYSVLRDLGAPGFQERNSESRLASLFRPLRDNRIDIGKAIFLEPAYYIPPAVDPQGLLRLRGGFEFRPRSIRFDIIFQFIDGGWKILGLSVVEVDANAPR